MGTDQRGTVRGFQRLKLEAAINDQIRVANTLLEGLINLLPKKLHYGVPDRPM